MSRHRRRSITAAAAVVTALLLGGCTTGESGPSGPAVAASQESAASIAFTPADTSAAVNPLSPIRVDVTQGTLTSVTLTNPDGKVIAGITTPDGTSWKPGEPLGYGKTYRLVVEAVDALREVPDAVGVRGGIDETPAICRDNARIGP